jgi:hypothetical protein
MYGYLVGSKRFESFYLGSLWSYVAEIFLARCASRRSKKIKNELEKCIEKVVIAIKKLLEDTGEISMLKFNTHESNEVAKAPLALSDGIAFHLLINNSGNLKKEKFWLQIRSMMLVVLKR